MSKRRTTIRAVFKDGVFKPMEPLELAEDSTVDLIIDPGREARLLDDLFRAIHRRNRDIPLQEVERDIARAIREVRGGK